MIVYKFFQINKYTYDVIKTGKFYFNDWEKMNDPMEGYYQYNRDEQDINIEERLKQEKKKYSICCFSNSYQEILMWSHYADKHQGICVELEVEENSNIQSVNVVYKKYITDIYPSLNTKDTAKHILKHKISKWSYEKERRFFLKKKKGTYKIGKITKILLGNRCNSKVKDIIKDIVNDEVPIFQCEIDFNTNLVEIN